MDIHPTYYALYQSGFCIVGIGETIESVLEDADTWLQTPPCLAEDGAVLTVQAITDYTRAGSPYGEVAGNLYLRRCTPRLAVYVQAHGTTVFVVRSDGVLDLRDAEGGR